MAKYKIKYDKKACVGCGMCASMYPEYWTMVETPSGSKAKPKKQQISEEELDENEAAADSCPSGAIKVVKMSARGSSENAVDFEEDDLSDF
tara:strand:- start:52 stop:324 length:273 start_codon:yes stop_codon:yes gene_type:complete